MWDNHFNYSNCKEHGEHGWHSRESTCVPPMWPEFDFQTQRHKRAGFVGSLLYSERFFCGYSGFSPLPKTIV